jgi:protein phosphatase
MTQRGEAFHFRSAAASHPGLVRRINEDAYLDRPDLGVWAVADGMGGHDAGDLASRVVVEALGAAPAPEFLGRGVSDLRRRLDEANRRLRAEASSRGKGVIGSTVVVLLAVGPSCAVLWAGDSRVYRLREGELQRISRDHSQVEELVSQGLLAREEAETHPAANVVTRAVGAEHGLEVDAQIERIEDRDRFLLCSDGLTKEVPEPEIERMLSGTDAEQATRALVRAACDRGGRDNVTVVVVDFRLTAAP